jgi:CubicO group peptidase (beta-lactamase class C family)
VFSSAICRRSAAAFAACVVVACTAWADPVDDYVRAQMAAFHLPGMSIAVVRDGTVIRTGGYGLANVESGTPATPDTVYKIASVSKQFIATAIMLLVQDGRLRLEDSVGRYLDGSPASWQPITIRELLTHTAGLVRESPGFDPMKAQSDLDIVKAVYHVPLRSTPGSKWEYSNAGYYVLAELISRLAGEPWPAFIDARVFSRTGMSKTALTSAPLANRAVGYTGNDNQRRADEWVAVRPSGAFLSTVGDLARWDATLNSDAVLTDTSRREMWTAVRLNDGRTYPYGFGWHVDTRKNRRVVWHGGGLPGFASYFGRYLDDGVSVIVLTNGDDADVVAIANGLADFYLAPSPR